TYSDPDIAYDYGAGYASDADGDGRSATEEGFSRALAAQLDALHAALDCDCAPGAGGFTVSGFTNLELVYLGSTGAGDLRVANTSDASTAYAYFPGDGVGGDIWLGARTRAPQAGNYGNDAILHELGHALGLKHPHEAEGGFGALPKAYDSPEFTVMTYRSYVGASTKTGYLFEDWGAPQSYMMLDIAALQALYGADFSPNSGNTTYRWTPLSGQTLVDGKVGIDPGENRIFATIWDGGGKDTYDLSAYGNDLCLDLRPGKGSVFADAQLADLGGGPNGGHARASIFNALQYQGDARSLIENACGGRGDDSLMGNAANNRLVGGAGEDDLRGLAGRDVLVGGKGDDRFVFVKVSESRPGACDRLEADSRAIAFDDPGSRDGDRIDLRGIDADTTRAGDQAFAFGAGHGRGHLWLEETEKVTYVCGNVDGDAAAELQLAIVDGVTRAAAYGADDFLL
ncbi:MAG TPA: M10 family metallopeptidase, partial [Amaricoccus sp.]|nr:M10 family metallopeptidase [Amaricoccus sp.]